jgi:hypothetical protein
VLSIRQGLFTLYFLQVAPDIATCLYYTEIDPFTKKEVTVKIGRKYRKMHRALMQFFKPANYFVVREALIEAGLKDLIAGCDGLIPDQPPKEAIEAMRREANQAIQGDHYHTVANPAREEKPGERGAEPAKGYRSGRSSQKRRQGKKKGK